MIRMDLQLFGGRSSAGGNAKASATKAAEPKATQGKVKQDVPIVSSIDGRTLGYKNVSNHTASNLYGSKEATEIRIGRVNPKTGRWQTEASINKYKGKWVGTAKADLSTRENFIDYLKGKSIRTRKLV